VTATATVRSRARVKLRAPNVALTCVPVAGLVLAAAANRTATLLPQSIRPVPTRLMAGPLRLVAFSLTDAELTSVLTVLFVAYIVAVVGAHRLSARSVLVAVLALHLFVVLAPPLFSTDVFSYQAYAREFTMYGANPYLRGPTTMELDPLYQLVGAKWITTPSVYGPLFTLFSGLFAHASITAFELCFRVLAALASLGVCRLLWLAAKLRGTSPVRALALWGLNPLVVLYGVGGGHNDLEMVLFMTAGIYVLLKRRELTGGTLIAIGAWLKLTGVVLAPFALVRDGAAVGRRPRLRFLIGLVLVSAVALGAGFAWFGGGLLRMPVTLESVQNENPWGSLPGILSALLGGETSHLIGVALGGVCVLFAAWLLRRVWQQRLDWLEAAGWLIVAMLSTASSVLPWYVCWLIPLVALCRRDWPWRASLMLTGVMAFLTIAGYFPGGTFLGI
jgi:hypothetical protein